ncbi:MAG: 30S ribosomal protein S8 [Anaerolineae bacterium]|nr:30S ribosomal protein S8 [Thermoflexales bacterium]MDW8395558.1 30S ribosomal protein S8 [Anaerolineae bacterium]
MANDTLGDMLTRIRNAAAVGHASVAVRGSKLNAQVARLLKEEGYIENYQLVEVDGKSFINITLRYTGERRQRRPVVTGLERVSKPGRRIYVQKNQIPRVLSGIGIAILSTPKGVVTDKQARRLGVGGELLCYVY